MSDDTLRAALVERLLDAVRYVDDEDVRRDRINEALAASATEERFGHDEGCPAITLRGNCTCRAASATDEPENACWSCHRLYADDAELYCGWCGAKARAASATDETTNALERYRGALQTVAQWDEWANEWLAKNDATIATALAASATGEPERHPLIPTDEELRAMWEALPPRFAASATEEPT